MKLTYRGVSYDYTPPQVEVSHSNTVGKYRGLDVRFRNPQKVMVQQPTLDLKYRGAAYANQPAPVAIAAPVAPTAATAEAAPKVSVSDRARMLLLNHHRTTKQRQQMLLTRTASEVGLAPETASHYWNHIQGTVHPSFWADYDRSSAAMS